jgi:hypothetical protein
LPVGLVLNSATGSIFGTPTILGTSFVTINATNAGGTCTAALIIIVNPLPPIINNTLIKISTVGILFSY